MHKRHRNGENLVPYHTRRGNVRQRKRPIHTHYKDKHNVITPAKRKVFTSLAQRPYEIGGQMDFERGDLKNIKAYFGNEYNLEYEYDPNWESDWHTHVDTGDNSVMPSEQDLLNAKETLERESIIFHKNIGLSIFEHDKFQHITKQKIKKVSDQLQEDYELQMPDIELYKKYKPIFRKELGVDLTWYPPNKPIHLKTVSK